MKFTPHDYQEACIDHALSLEGVTRQLYAAPTGTGKSIPELILLDKLPHCWLVTPKIEIIADMLEKLTGKKYVKQSTIIAMGLKHRITTPIRMRNMMLQGKVNPRTLIIDEVHHGEADTYTQLLLMCGDILVLGFTATPYRGTPKGTVEFRKNWGEPIWLITMEEAIRRELFKMPTCTTVPLIDDDLVALEGGEFVVETVKRETESKLRDIGNLIISKGLDIATMIAMPTRDNIYALEDYLKTKGFPCNVVTDKTKTTDRIKYFRECEECIAALLQIKAVSEGNDLKVRRLIDCIPTMSPVFFMQRFGRICRPYKGKTEYICTNRNLLRHAYLFEGNLPVYEYNESRKMFPTDSTRMGIRAWDIESMGGFKPARMKFANDTYAEVYSVVKSEGNLSTEYTAIVHPLCEEVIWGKRTNQKGQYGTYVRLDSPPASIKGYASKTGTLTPAQESFFRSKANSFGLDKDAKLDRRIFQGFIMLKDLRIRMK